MATIKATGGPSIEEYAEFLRQFQQLPDDKKQLMIDKARELLAEQEARESNHGR